jgi:methylphosphotriester-DNA--protein-cysteine methyltransferase
VVGYQGSYHLPECKDISSLSSALLTRYNAPLKAQKDGLQPCAECNPYAWHFAAPAAPPAAPTKPAPVPPKPAPTAPAAKKTVINPVIANRDTGAYHRPDCEDAVITPKDVTIKFDSLGEAELAGFRRCQTCKPSSRAMPRNAPQQAVVGNNNTNIYHRPECEWANAIGHSKRVKFNSPSDAEGSGYRRCLTCRPGENVAAGTVIGDRDKMVFHRASCDLLDRVEYRWQVKFDKVADAAQANYQPCPVCHP